jgi:hypothetical protein
MTQEAEEAAEKEYPLSPWAHIEKPSFIKGYNSRNMKDKDTIKLLEHRIKALEEQRQQEIDSPKAELEERKRLCMELTRRNSELLIELSKHQQIIKELIQPMGSSIWAALVEKAKKLLGEE